MHVRPSFFTVVCIVLALSSLAATCAHRPPASEAETSATEASTRPRRSPNILYADEIRQAQATNLTRLLVGRVPGVYEEGGRLYVRGASTFMGSREPLYLLDRIPMDTQPVVSLNDIESIEVLKGPDASAYGMRGSNGVIIITTRRP